MKTAAKITAIILLIVLFSGSAFAGDVNIQNEITETGEALCHMGGSKGTLSNEELFPAGSATGDWAAIALTLSKTEADYKGYAGRLKNYVEESYAEKGYLDNIRATEYHRVILTALALKEDPESFGKDAEGNDINLLKDGVYNFVGGEPWQQGINGLCYALIALNASGEEMPEDCAYTEKELVEKLISFQEEDGGFGLVEGSSDTDMTSMALQALSFYKDEYQEQTDKAVLYLAGKMNDSCGFGAGGEDSAESIAQAIIALCSAGIHPCEDSRFTRGENNMIASLERFKKEDGTYGHLISDENGDALATSQSLLALMAVNNLENGEGNIFDLKNIEAPPQKEGVNTAFVIIIIAAAAAAVTVITVLRKRNK